MDTLIRLPQSHWQTQYFFSDVDFSISNPSTVRRPKRCPFRLIPRTSDVISFCRHPHDFVCPVLRCVVVTSTKFPQSQRHTHFALVVFLDNTTKRPKRCPTKSIFLLFAADVFSFCRHPQDCVCPLVNEVDNTSFSFPQSHLHRH